MDQLVCFSRYSNVISVKMSKFYCHEAQKYSFKEALWLDLSPTPFNLAVVHSAMFIGAKRIKAFSDAYTRTGFLLVYVVLKNVEDGRYVECI